MRSWWREASSGEGFDILVTPTMAEPAPPIGEIKGASLNISELFSLVEGDIIPVDSPEKIDVKVNGVTKFQARMGELNGRVGLKIIS